MRFSPQFLDELRARLPVSEVVGKRVKLRKAGREWKGLSPFNKEKTPSFTVNDQKGFYHDFSSGKHGSIFDFVMETEGVTFPEAVERLAQMAGVPVPQVTPEAEEREERRKTLHDVVEIAAKYFEATLTSRFGARGRGYLADRGIEPSTQLRFRLGYASNERFALKEHLGGEKISPEDMVEAGLLVSGEDIPVPYDRFRDRVMFPISDFRGRVIAFGGRALEKDAPAKYLNSPETPLFHKGATLFNIANARKAAHEGARVIAVEGYIDVIAMVMAGFEGTVAPLGTALTADQLALTWKMADEPILCFDGDDAGRRAAYRAVDIALPLLKPGKSLKFAALPDGQDPDDLARSGGREAIEDVLGASRPLAQVLWSREIESGAFETPERRAALEARLGEVTNAIADEFGAKILSPGFWRAPASVVCARRSCDAAARLGRAWRAPRCVPGGVQGRIPGRSFGPAAIAARHVRPRRTLCGDEPAACRQPAASRPSGRDTAARGADPAGGAQSPLAAPRPSGGTGRNRVPPCRYQKLKGALIDLFAHDGDTDQAGLAAELTRRGFGELLARLDRGITTTSVWGARPDAAKDDVLSTWKQLVALHRQWHSLTRELKDAELAMGQDNSEANYTWLRDVKARLSILDGTEALIEGFGAASGRPARSL